MTNLIGAPNSVARYLSESTFGANKFLVLERAKGELILRAAQTTLDGARKYHKPNMELVDIENCRILPYVETVKKT